MAVFDVLTEGLVVGSYVAIAAIGFTLIYGIVNMINFAYGEIVTIGGYLSFFLIAEFGISLLAALPIVVVGTAVIGLLISSVAFEPIIDTGAIPLLLTSIGLVFFIQNGLGFAFGLSPRFIGAGLPSFDLLWFRPWQVFVIGTALLTFIAIHFMLTKTNIGIAMRAMGDNKNLARVIGVDSKRVRTYIWLISSGLAGLVGVLLASNQGITPFLGFDQILIIIAAAILGGVGSPYGAIIGSYIIGVVIAGSVSYLPADLGSLGTTMAFLVLILVLILKPTGIGSAKLEVR